MVNRTAVPMVALALSLLIGLTACHMPGQPLPPPSEVTLEIQYVGISCGSHLQWAENLTTVSLGTTVKFTNDTPYWTIPIKVADSSDLLAPALLESPPIRPGESWTYTFSQPGEFFLTSTQMMQQQAGLAGWITVQN